MKLKKYMGFFLRKGFTLVELMIVIAIIGILAAVLYPSFTGYFERARDTKKKQELKIIENALVLHGVDYGNFRVAGTGHSGWGNGWANFNNSDGSHITYKKSLIEGLRELGYLNPKTKLHLSKDLQKSISNKNNSPCSSNITMPDAYMIYLDATGNRYSLTAYLERATDKDREHIQTLENGTGSNATCGRYGRNYGIGN